MTTGAHSAAASAAGYQHQTRWALVNLLREGRHRPDLVLSLEMHDDVAWSDADGNATELLQTKLHAKSTVGLGDKDTDVWKTLLIWLKRPDARDPDGPELALVTTSVASDGTAAHALRPDLGSRDVPAAMRLLTAAATSSSAEATKAGRTKFLELTEAERTTFLERVRVLDAELAPEDLQDAVAAELAYGLPLGEGPRKMFLGQVWQWWDGISVDLLRGNRGGVAVSQVNAFVQELRDQFGPGGLWTTVHLDDVTDEDVEARMQDRFVEQLKLVRYPLNNLRKAVVDYHRAVTQETRWLDDSLLGIYELRRFEENLRDEWETAFENMLDDLGDGWEELPEEAKQKAGKVLLRRLLDSPAVTVRRHYADPFFARGKRHQLANSSEPTGIGWHPEFVTRLAAVVGQPAAVVASA